MKNSVKFVVLAVVVLSPIGLGCIWQSRLTISAPDSIEVSAFKATPLVVEVLAMDADATNVAVNLSGSPELLFGGRGNKSIEKVVKGQKTSTTFEYVVNSPGDFILTIDAVASNAKPVNKIVNIIASIAAPTFETGEFWLYNQSKEDEPGLRIDEVVGRETILLNMFTS